MDGKSDYYKYYKQFSQEGSKIGKLMLVQQSVFQIGSVVLLFIFLVVIGIFAGIKGGSFDTEAFKTAARDPQNTQICTYLGSAAMQIIASIIFIIFARENKDIMKNAPIEGGHLSLWLMVKGWFYITAMGIVLTSITYFLGLLVGAHPGDHLLLNSDHKILLFILTSIFPGIVEELLYRGILFRYLRRHGFFYAALVSSVIFGLLHLNFSQAFFAGTMGFVLCYVYDRSGHLWPCMILHALHNGSVILLTLIDNQDVLIVPVLYLGVNCLAALISIFFVSLKPKIVTDKTAIKKTLTATPLMILIIGILIFCTIRVIFRF